KEHGTNEKTLERRNEFSKAFEALKLKNMEELYQALGSGKVRIMAFLAEIPSIDLKLVDENKANEKEDSLYKKISQSAKRSTNRDNAVIVDGLDDIMVRMGKCCNPIPGDPIVG